MFHLSPAEIAAYGGILTIIIVPLGNFFLAKYKNKFTREDKEFNDGVEIRKELRKEVERLNKSLDDQDTYYRSESSKRDDIINQLKLEKEYVSVKLARTEALYADCLAKVQEFKDKVVAQGEKVVEQIKKDAETNL